ncbi:unnamed protein product [Leptosia nina]|uniref:Centrosome-associated protein 350 n=1 Tax=Leptosia nina TaxID=320188 RepID=A0AAV1JZ99_9NEOP
MDACASVKTDSQFKKLCSLYVEIENTFPLREKPKSSVIKYTRLPEFDFSSTEKWSKNNYVLEPRLRRFVAIEEPLIETTRSLKANVASLPKMATTAYSKRKFVTIEEDEEKSLHPKFSREVKSSYSKVLGKAVEVGMKDQKLSSQRTTSRLSNTTKSPQDTMQNIKAYSYNYSKNNASAANIRTKQTKENDPVSKGKESLRYIRSTNAPTKTAMTKKIITPTDSGKEIQIIKNKLKEECKSPMSRRVTSKEKIHKTSPEHGRLKNNNLLKELSERKKPLNIIHVPLEKEFESRELTDQILKVETEIKKNMVDCSTDIEGINIYNDKSVGTESLKTIDQITETEHDPKEISQTSASYAQDKITFDNLEIPNVTLIKDKCEESKENLVNFCSQSLPNLRVPSFSVTPKEKQKMFNKTCLHKSTSYIISSATLTYTTQQKINFQLVENKIDMDLSPAAVAYPMNVISVYKKELKDRNESENIDKLNDEEINKSNSHQNTHVQVNPSSNSLKNIDRNNLMKPSDLISTINADNSLLPNDYINEQFQRELNFIDSFFESLQYLENCSLSDKRLTQSNVDDLVNNTYDLKKLEYDSFFSKFENPHIVDDCETIASKSLCLLNLLIRDEQRRAKNLLFVLKMREDALKDFTKSQLLWLENRKRQDNTDISTLKKKQRGALLKLQHECGEMQRMRKALLTLSEKRKVALMKTKRNIELKFNNHVDVEQIIMEKRKLKRSTSADRNTAPLKCFDLSSSGCEESTTSRPKSITPVCALKSVVQSESAEKCVQTGDSILSTTTVNQSTTTDDENFVVVDGGYLNILFQNLTLPEIFSSGKQYEVNQEALRNIVATTNNKTTAKEGDVIKSFMDQVKNHELDNQSSSPSTARSLVEEFDQYYKGLAIDDKSPIESPEANVREVKDIGVQILDWNDSELKSVKDDDKVNRSVESVDRDCSCELATASVETQADKGKEDLIGGRSVAGPLPVPAGEAAVTEASTQDQLTWPDQKSSSSSSPGESSSTCTPILYPSVSSIVTPAQNEAEELRRQQLAIEREIKALEQQQCQLLVVREIPDKPPPPYTPPTETRTPKPRKFSLDEAHKEKVIRYVTETMPQVLDDVDLFDTFLKDFCQETIDRHTKEEGDKFWDTCHDLPPKKKLDADMLAAKTSFEIKEVLTGVPPTVVSGVGARRSDHIDDILFAEWRRCEPEWTSLHTDEVIVKNQIFESIFQKILTETVDEYKKSVVLKRNNNVT